MERGLRELRDESDTRGRERERKREKVVSENVFFSVFGYLDDATALQWQLGVQDIAKCSVRDLQGALPGSAL